MKSSGKFTNHDSSGRPKGSHLQKWLNKSRQNIPIFSAWLEQAVRGGEFGVVRPPIFTWRLGTSSVSAAMNKDCASGNGSRSSIIHFIT